MRAPNQVLVVRTRWALGLAAALAALTGACGGDDDTETADTTAAPATTAAPTTTATTEPPTTTAAPTTAPPTTAPPGPDVDVTDVGWAGDGSACLTLAGTTGCFPGGAIRTAAAGGTPAFVTGEETVRVVVSLDDGEVVVTGGEPADPCDVTVAVPADVWLADVACGEGDAALWSRLPTEPVGEEAAHEAVQTQTGATIPLDVVSLGDDWQVLRAVVDVGAEVECTLAVPLGGEGWHEWCDITSGPMHPGVLVAVDGGDAVVIDPVAGRVDPLGDAPLRTNGCTDPVRDVLGDAPVVMYGWLHCDGDAAAGAVGSVFVQAGPVDGSLVTFARDADGAWTVTDDGTGIDLEIDLLPIPDVDAVLLDASAAAVGFEDVSEEARSWLAGDPGALVSDVVVANAGETTSSQVIPTPDMVAIPTLVFVEVGFPDDSVGGARYAVWMTEPDDGSNPLAFAYRWNLCSRGGDPATGLCV